MKFTTTTLKRMKYPNRFVPSQILKQATKGKAYKDPRGSKAKMYYTTMYKNGKKYNLEVLYNKKDNKIYHFMYTRKALGPLKEEIEGEMKMTDRQKLIKLIESYLEKQITAKTFSDNYEMLYWRDLDEDGSISAEEEEEFRELGEVVARYSPFEEELIKYDSVYFSGEDVYRTAKKVYRIIKNI